MRRLNGSRLTFQSRWTLLPNVFDSSLTPRHSSALVRLLFPWFFFAFWSRLVSSLPSFLQFHDGLGFLTNHALMTNTFEYSLQAVNPKLTLPYWDYTIESSSAGAKGFDSADVQTQTKTPLLQASWFGTGDPEDNMVCTSILTIFICCCNSINYC